jgi:hypothetical protein
MFFDYNAVALVGHKLPKYAIGGRMTSTTGWQSQSIMAAASEFIDGVSPQRLIEVSLDDLDHW